MSSPHVPIARRDYRKAQLREGGPRGGENRNCDRDNEPRKEERTGGGKSFVNLVSDRRRVDAQLASIFLQPVDRKRGHFAPDRSIVVSLAFTVAAIEEGSGA